jgi:hypothetical protein
MLLCENNRGTEWDAQPVERPNTGTLDADGGNLIGSGNSVAVPDSAEMTETERLTRHTRARLLGKGRHRLVQSSALPCSNALRTVGAWLGHRLGSAS